MSQLAQCARDIPINVQRTARKPVIENLFPGTGIGYNRNKGVLMHTAIDFSLHHRQPECRPLTFHAPGHKALIAFLSGISSR